MNGTTGTLEDVRADLSLSEGRVALTAENESVTVRLRTPRERPLSRQEPALLVEASGDGLQASLWLDAEDAAVLADVLADVAADVDVDGAEDAADGGKVPAALAEDMRGDR